MNPRPRYLFPMQPWLAREIQRRPYLQFHFHLCQQWFWGMYAIDGTNPACCEWVEEIANNNPIPFPPYSR